MNAAVDGGEQSLAYALFEQVRRNTADEVRRVAREAVEELRTEALRNAELRVMQANERANEYKKLVEIQLRAPSDAPIITLREGLMCSLGIAALTFLHLTNPPPQVSMYIGCALIGLSILSASIRAVKRWRNQRHQHTHPQISSIP